MAEPWAGGPYANDAYLRSLAQSSSDVKRQVRNALDEINRQRVVAAGQVNQIPGATATAFTQGRDTLQGHLGTVGADMLPSLADAFKNGPGSFERASGLLQQGFAERQTRQRGGVNTVSEQLIADLRSKANEFISTRQREDQQRAWQEQENAKQRALQQQIAAQQIAATRAAAAAQVQAAQRGRDMELADAYFRMGAIPPGWDHQRMQAAIGLNDRDYMLWVAQHMPKPAGGPTQRPVGVGLGGRRLR